MEKMCYDTSEPIIVTGIALNNSKIDGASFTAVPLGANDELHFVLRKLTRSRQTISFSAFDLTPAALSWNSINLKLAPQERGEVFSFNLKNFTRTNDIYFPNCLTPVIYFVYWEPGIYEFSWQVGWSGGLSKPVYFEIK